MKPMVLVVLIVVPMNTRPGFAQTNLTLQLALCVLLAVEQVTSLRIAEANVRDKAGHQQATTRPRSTKNT